MIPIPHPPNHDYHEYSQRCPAGVFPCIVCGRPVRKPKYWVHTYYGADLVTEEEAQALNKKEIEENLGFGDTGCYPVGLDCLKRFPEIKPYLQKE